MIKDEKIGNRPKFEYVDIPDIHSLKQRMDGNTVLSRKTCPTKFNKVRWYTAGYTMAESDFFQTNPHVIVFDTEAYKGDKGIYGGVSPDDYWFFRCGLEGNYQINTYVEIKVSAPNLTNVGDYFANQPDTIDFNIANRGGSDILTPKLSAIRYRNYQATADDYYYGMTEASTEATESMNAACNLYLDAGQEIQLESSLLGRAAPTAIDFTIKGWIDITFINDNNEGDT